MVSMVLGAPMASPHTDSTLLSIATEQLSKLYMIHGEAAHERRVMSVSA